MYKKLFISTLLFMQMLGLSSVSAADISEGFRKELGDFFGVRPDRISIECPSEGYKLQSEDKDKVLNICLYSNDKKNRCEITVHALEKAPLKNTIAFDINVDDPEPRKRWQSVMQIHSFPDKGEQWRCPVAPLEIINGHYRLVDRWDASEISRVSGYNCTEPGSSITGKIILDKTSVRAGEWQSVKIDALFSPFSDGEFSAEIDGDKSGLIAGPNTYNDKRGNFLKFGIYKPAGWEQGHTMSCVKYRNVKIGTYQ